ncbi:MAG: FmdB family zinc ribbon protein [Desulfobacca sp.]|uniref:FmdB family zinc ribbon protein n=1 Tax=Desulfobacca sp. TaxID=2067990 RepID=UPI004048EE16
MPIYEYQCEACGQITEEWQKFSDPPLTTCKHCQGNLTKLISHSAFHLKGGGWYVSEYGSKKPNSATSSANKSETKGESKSETPAAKAGADA